MDIIHSESVASQSVLVTATNGQSLMIMSIWLRLLDCVLVV